MIHRQDAGATIFYLSANLLFARSRPSFYTLSMPNRPSRRRFLQQSAFTGLSVWIAARESRKRLPRERNPAFVFAEF